MICDSLRDSVLSLLDQLSLIPVSSKDKRPLASLMPVNDKTGKRGWEVYQSRRAAGQEWVGWLGQYPVDCVAVVCGGVSSGLVVIDFDVSSSVVTA